MTRKEKILTKAFVDALFREHGIKEVTTDKQVKNGTIALEFPSGDRVASYKSGYVRRVSKNNSKVYQLNRIYKRNNRYTVLSNGNLKSYDNICYARELIYGSIARLEFIRQFYIRNYL
jgi:hypothetical protein